MEFIRSRKKPIGVTAAILLVAFIVVEALSYAIVDKSNPAVKAEPAWDSPRTRELAKAACFDCHSNETIWPWYSNLAPASWLLWHDVDEGRGKLNFSEWDQGEGELDEITEVIDEGEMPPWYYALMHPDAKLSESEKGELIAGLSATIAQSGGISSESSSD